MQKTVLVPQTCMSKKEPEMAYIVDMMSQGIKSGKKSKTGSRPTRKRIMVLTILLEGGNPEVTQTQMVTSLS